MTAVPRESPAVSGYRLLQFVGEGAFGSVWLAEENLTGVQRAIKLFPKRGAPGCGDPARELAGVRTYQQTIRDHPALLQILHVGETDEFYYYVMDAADPAAQLRAEDPSPRPSQGRTDGFDLGAGSSGANADVHNYVPLTLAYIIRHEAPLAADRALDIAAQILRGLEHLHAHGLIHRDVKPSNILVVNGEFKLGDLGLVTSMDHTITQIGTPGYLPPGGAIDHTSDLYAAGIVLYEMITGLHRSRFPELPVLRPKTRRERHDLRMAIRIANRAAHPNRSMRYSLAGLLLQDASARRSPRGKARYRVAGAVSLPVVLLALTVGILQTAQPIVRDTLVENGTTIVVRFWNGWRRRIEFPYTVSRPVIVRFAGQNQPLLAVGTSSTSSHPGRLIAINPLIDSVAAVEQPLLDVPLYRDPPADWDNQTFEPPCGVIPVLAQDLDGNKGDELVVVVAHDDAPTELILFESLSTRRTLAWHYGHLGEVHAVNLFGDERPELVFGGFANERAEFPKNKKLGELGHFVLMIIDPQATGLVRWTMNDWMNDAEHPPLAYGWVRYVVPSPDGQGWSPAGDGAVDINPNRPSAPIYVRFTNGLMITLTGELIARNVQTKDMYTTYDGGIPDTSDVWSRNAPVDVKETPEPGE